MKQTVSQKKSILQTTTPKSGATLWQKVWRERWIYLLIIPGVLYFVAFQYVPLLGNVIAFQDFSPFLGFFDSPWIGLSNFARLFSDPDVATAVINTLIISLLQIVFAFPIPIALAIMLNNMVSNRARRFLQSVPYLPHFISWVIIIS